MIVGKQVRFIINSLHLILSHIISFRVVSFHITSVHFISFNFSFPFFSSHSFSYPLSLFHSIPSVPFRSISLNSFLFISSDFVSYHCSCLISNLSSHTSHFISFYFIYFVVSYLIALISMSARLSCNSSDCTLSFGSLVHLMSFHEAKLLTIWTDGKAQPGRNSGMGEVRREKIRDGDDQKR